MHQNVTSACDREALLLLTTAEMSKMILPLRSKNIAWMKEIYTEQYQQKPKTWMTSSCAEDQT